MKLSQALIRSLLHRNHQSRTCAMLLKEFGILAGLRTALRVRPITSAAEFCSVYELCKSPDSEKYEILLIISYKSKLWLST